MHDAEDCEASEGGEVLVAEARPAAPAGGAGDEAGVEDKEEEREPVRKAGGQGRADEV